MGGIQNTFFDYVTHLRGNTTLASEKNPDFEKKDRKYNKGNEKHFQGFSLAYICEILDLEQKVKMILYLCTIGYGTTYGI